MVETEKNNYSKVEFRNDSINEAVGFGSFKQIWGRFLSCSNQAYIIIGSIIFGIMTWLIDTIFDYLMVPNISFMHSLAGDIDGHKIHLRLFILIFFLVFGFIIARLKKTIIDSKNDLKKSEAKYKSFIEETNNLVTQVDASGQTSIPIYDDNGNLMVKNGIGRDITDRKQMEKK